MNICKRNGASSTSIFLHEHMQEDWCSKHMLIANLYIFLHEQMQEDALSTRLRTITSLMSLLTDIHPERDIQEFLEKVGYLYSKNISKNQIITHQY